MKTMGKTGNGCARCVWRLVLSGGKEEGRRYICGYSLCLGHHSRVWLHYQRTGRESLVGFTSGEGCSEFMAGNPKDKLSLMQENVGRVNDRAWALLEREGIIAKGSRRGSQRRAYATTVDMDIEKANELRRGRSWREIAETTGLSIAGVKGSWERQRINRIAAQRLKDAYGIDITK